MSLNAQSLSRWSIAILSVLGLLVSCYMTYSFFSSGTDSFCTAGSGCDAVKASAYSTLFGVPVSLFGAGGYLLLFLISTVGMSKKKRWTRLYYLSLIALSFSVYLTYIELFVINAICPYCVTSAVIILIIFILLLLDRPKAVQRMDTSGLVKRSVMVAIAVILVSFLAQFQGFGSVADGGREALLAKHLTSNGAAMYGTFWCPHCKEQKELFGSAMKYINYVDCDGDAPKNADPALCIKKGVMRYPTWEINGKLYEGTRSLDELEYLSGFER